MLIITTFAQEMVIVRIYLHLELFACLYKRIYVQKRILRMHVIICQAMHNEQFSI